MKHGKPLHLTVRVASIDYIRRLEALLQQAKEDAERPPPQPQSVHALAPASTSTLALAPAHAHTPAAPAHTPTPKKKPRSATNTTAAAGGGGGGGGGGGVAADDSSSSSYHIPMPEISFERPGQSALVLVDVANIKLGRDPHAHVQLLDDKNISKRHARVRWDSREQAFVLHHFGRNATRVDGASLDFDGARAILKDGAKIELGDIQLSVRVQKPKSRRRASEGGDTESD